jgi:type II secretory pathway component PulF
MLETIIVAGNRGLCLASWSEWSTARAIATDFGGELFGTRPQSLQFSDGIFTPVRNHGRWNCRGNRGTGVVSAVGGLDKWFDGVNKRLSKYFPTFNRIVQGAWGYSAWKSTPWWPAESLASKQKSLLRVLAVAAAERLEAMPLVSALAVEHRGRYRRRLRRLAHRLSAGLSLADAIEQTPGVLSDEQNLAIRFGEQSGTLSTTLKSLLDDKDQASQRIVARLRQIGFYGSVVLSIFVFIVSFMLIKIIPSFRAIFDDFDLNLPRITELLIRISNTVVNYWWLLVLVILPLAWLVKSERARRFFRRKISSRLIRPIAQLRSANVLTLLAGNTRSGRPIAGALSTLARYHFDEKIRHKLLFVRNEVEQGTNVWQSMAAAKLLSAVEARALNKASSADSRAWTMDRLASLKRDRVERRIDVYVSLLQPAMILLMAAAVLFIAVACLTPLFDLTSSLTG